ncbi:copper-binding protein (plasmid) [Pukyongiella litopenaei]|uniref:Copper-binding protein n=2 Tax=Pukyongiella litopenaei TaxID=2605946 RepID=A0A5C2H6J3_9RHOB|nr:copper-binding protein [Pukyongiella litopenaei]
MRGLTRLTRRRLGQGLGTAMALAGLPGILRAHDGTHEVTVRIERFAFDPPEIELLVGDSVTWINGDVAPHTATALGGWDTGSIEQDGQSRITFDSPGEHHYICGFHPHMKGTVVVRAKTDG